MEVSGGNLNMMVIRFRNSWIHVHHDRVVGLGVAFYNWTELY